MIWRVAIFAGVADGSWAARMQRRSVGHDIPLLFWRLYQCLGFRVAVSILVINLLLGIASSTRRHIRGAIGRVFSLDIVHWGVCFAISEVVRCLVGGGGIVGDVGRCRFCHCMRSLIVGGLIVLVVGRDCEAEGKSWAMFVLIRTRSEQRAAPGNKVDKGGPK